jgi:hypothetical protein
VLVIKPAAIEIEAGFIPGIKSDFPFDSEK